MVQVQQRCEQVQIKGFARSWKCPIPWQYLYGNDMRIQRYGIRFVTLTTAIAAAVPCRITMATRGCHKAPNPTISVTLARAIVSLLFYLRMFESDAGAK